MRILLTGSSGLIGQAVRAELSRDHQIISLGRGDAADVQMDLSDPVSMAALQLPEADALLHCAGIVDEDFRENTHRAFLMALAGADALVRSAVAAGVSRMGYVSSAHVYGHLVGAIDENNPVNPVSDYAIAHYATEQIFRRQSSASIAVAAFRPCAVFGELERVEVFRRWALIPYSFTLAAVKQRKIVIRSTGEQRRNFVGTRDIAAAMRSWLASDARAWQVINPIGALSCTVYEFAQLCARISDELCSGACVIERFPLQGGTAGDDFDYRSVSPLGQGRQSASEFIRNLSRQVSGIEL